MSIASIISSPVMQFQDDQHQYDSTDPDFFASLHHDSLSIDENEIERTSGTTLQVCSLELQRLEHNMASPVRPAAPKQSTFAKRKSTNPPKPQKKSTKPKKKLPAPDASNTKSKITKKLTVKLVTSGKKVSATQKQVTPKQVSGDIIQVTNISAQPAISSHTSSPTSTEPNTPTSMLPPFLPPPKSRKSLLENPYIVKVEPSPRVHRGSLIKIVGQNFREYQSIQIGQFLLSRKQIYAIRRDCVIVEIPLCLESGLVALTIGGSARTYVHVESQQQGTQTTRHDKEEVQDQDRMDTVTEQHDDDGGVEMYLQEMAVGD